MAGGSLSEGGAAREKAYSQIATPMTRPPEVRHPCIDQALKLWTCGQLRSARQSTTGNVKNARGWIGLDLEDYRLRTRSFASLRALNCLHKAGQPPKALHYKDGLHDSTSCKTVFPGKVHTVPGKTRFFPSSCSE